MATEISVKRAAYGCHSRSDDSESSGTRMGPKSSDDSTKRTCNFTCSPPLTPAKTFSAVFVSMVPKQKLIKYGALRFGCGNDVPLVFGNFKQVKCFSVASTSRRVVLKIWKYVFFKKHRSAFGPLSVLAKSCNKPSLSLRSDVTCCAPAATACKIPVLSVYMPSSSSCMPDLAKVVVTLVAGSRLVERMCRVPARKGNGARDTQAACINFVALVPHCAGGCRIAEPM
mmetsp:Transcript_67932/g.176470  ORF Transcript_67932/g.176470 Transcript_67932/m.176470 type:complete len:227 (+) Transcript_67932:566-1246(+)